MLQDLHFLLLALRCGKDIDPENYDVLAKDWIRRFHANPDLNWHWMSPTIHVLVYHGADLIRVLPIAAGLSSEEVAEADNKVGSKSLMYF